MNQKDIEKLSSVINSDEVFGFSIPQLKEYLNLLHAPDSKENFTGEDYRAIDNKLKLALQLQIKNELKNPHWTVTPSFWLIIASIITTIIFGVLSLLHH